MNESRTAGSRPGRRPRIALGDDGSPRLLADEPRSIVEAVAARTRGFVPEWKPRGDDDAGAALVRVFAEQVAAVVTRANRLPEKALVEYLRMSGVGQAAATPAAALLEFSLAESALESVTIGRGFQVGAQSATGGPMVVFETQDDLVAVPATIEEVDVETGRLFSPIDLKRRKPFLPFGGKADAGKSLVIGLKVEPAAPVGSSLSIAVVLAAPFGTPTPVGRGGLVPFPVAPTALLEWEVLDGGLAVPVAVVRDDTAGFRRSGVVQLRLPRAWRPYALTGPKELRWLRVRIGLGKYDTPPVLASIHLNAVPALGVRTVRNELLEAIAESDGRRFRLSAAPVVPASLEIVVDDESRDAFNVADTSDSAGSAGWRRVDDLSAHGPADRVYVLDAATGEVTFGDDVHGAGVPMGIGNVRAVRYQVGGGRGGSVAADAISVLIDSAPFVDRVTNPYPASGGTDIEPRERILYRGPTELRARGRTVVPADYAALALHAPGADVQRAFAAPGLHPRYPGRPIPGVVGVFVVPPLRGAGPPVPNEATLASVARYLSETVAPAGVEIVAAAPRYQYIRANVQVAVTPGADVTAAIRSVLDQLDSYLDPLTGGEQGDGWPFGAPLTHPALLRRLLHLKGVAAVERITLTVDGRVYPPCTDFATAPFSLLWPDGHEVVPVSTRAP